MRSSRYNEERSACWLGLSVGEAWDRRLAMAKLRTGEDGEAWFLCRGSWRKRVGPEHPAHGFTTAAIGTNTRHAARNTGYAGLRERRRRGRRPSVVEMTREQSVLDLCFGSSRDGGIVCPCPRDTVQLPRAMPLHGCAIPNDHWRVTTPCAQ